CSRQLTNTAQWTLTRACSSRSGFELTEYLLAVLLLRYLPAAFLPLLRQPIPMFRDHSLCILAIRKFHVRLRVLEESLGQHPIRKLDARFISSEVEILGSRPWVIRPRSRGSMKGHDPVRGRRGGEFDD